MFGGLIVRLTAGETLYGIPAVGAEGTLAFCVPILIWVAKVAAVAVVERQADPAGHATEL